MLREVLQHSSAAKYVYFLITLFHHSSFRYLTGEYRTLPSFSIVQMLETSRGKIRLKSSNASSTSFTSVIRTAAFNAARCRARQARCQRYLSNLSLSTLSKEQIGE